MDLPRRIADVLFRFDAGQQIVLHRQGPQPHLRDPRRAPALRDGRPPARVRPHQQLHRLAIVSEAPHREGGGAEDAIVLFGMRLLPGET